MSQKRAIKCQISLLPSLMGSDRFGSLLCPALCLCSTEVFLEQVTRLQAALIWGEKVKTPEWV